jgi:hypothetical protein
MIEFTKTYGKKNNDGTPKIFTHDVFLFQGRYGRFNPLFFLCLNRVVLNTPMYLGTGSLETSIWSMCFLQICEVPKNIICNII